MEERLKISVIVPIFNAEKTLERCLESLVNQTYEPYEIVLVDDGSDDLSGEICDCWSKKYPMIKVIHKSNEGSGYARNSGIAYASGDFIVFVDSDDYFAQGLLEHLAEGRQDGEDAVLAGYVRVSPIDRNEQVYQYEPKCFYGDEIKEDFLCRLVGSAPEVQDSIDIGPTHVLYDLNLIKSHAILFPSEREYISEDLLFNISYYQHATKVRLIDSSDYYYVATEGSLTKKYRADRFEKVLKLYNKQNEILNSIGIYEKAKIRTQKAFFNWVRMCLAQEKMSVSSKKRKEQIESIKEICDNEIVVQAIKKYPIKRLHFKQRVFLRLIEMKAAFLLSICVELRIIAV